jgi:arsenate reductase
MSEMQTNPIDPWNAKAIDFGNPLEAILVASRTLDKERAALLWEASEKTRAQRNLTGAADLVFVCTHNSRRSHFAQFWAQVAADDAGIDNLTTYSCGTEATACNARTVAALKRFGAKISVAARSPEQAFPANPRYIATIPFSGRQQTLFSKAFGHSSLPSSGMIALFCCDDADEKCPAIPTAASRVALRYVDPKVSDDTPAESETYDAACLQIASEMFYLMRLIAHEA